MIVLLNPASLVLGLIAWTLPVINIVQYKNNKHRNWGVFSIISLSMCSISIYFQIIYTNHLVNISDWSALMDTTNALVFVTSVLIILTLTLNAINLFIYRDRISN